VVVDCSNSFYLSPNKLVIPGTVRVMGEGWETARRRDGGNDHVTMRLAEEGLLCVPAAARAARVLAEETASAA
jgi:allantoicase